MAKEERVIKRYTNRKLYDTKQSRYVTLDDIARLVREGEDVRVVDNETTEDLTSVTLAQIILEEEKRKSHFISVPFLRTLVRSGEAAVQDLSDRASRGFEAIGEITEKASGRVREVVEEGGRALDEGRHFIDDALRAPQKRLEALRDTLRKSVDRLRHSPALQREIERLEKSLHTIEEMVGKLREKPADSEPEPGPVESTASIAPETEGGPQTSEPEIVDEDPDDIRKYKSSAEGR